MVTDPDDGATFTVTSVSCGANGSQAGVTITTATGGSFACLFIGESISTVSVLVTDNLNAPSNTATLDVTIAKAATDTVVTCPVSVDYTGAAQTPCTATVTSADGLNQSLTVTYAANVDAGTATASAAYGGDVNHAGSSDSTTFVINQLPSSTVVTCPVSVSYSGAAQTPCTATVTSADGLGQSLTVTYAANVDAGTATASAAYGGDGNHAGSADSTTFVITPLASHTVVSCPVSVNYSGVAQTPCTATVTSTDGLSQLLTPTYTANINAGTATASAAYGGDGNHAGSDGSATFAINPLASHTVVSCPVSVNYSGVAQTPCTATVTSTGRVQPAVDADVYGEHQRGHRDRQRGVHR